MCLTAEWRRQRKQSMNWKKEQQKLSNLNNTEKTTEQRLRDLWDYNKKSAFVSLQFWKEREGGGENVLKEI